MEWGFAHESKNLEWNGGFAHEFKNSERLRNTNITPSLWYYISQWKDMVSVTLAVLALLARNSHNTLILHSPVPTSTTIKTLRK